MNDRHITTANWGVAPHNRTSFQHVQQLFPTARIRRGAGPIVPFEVDGTGQLNLDKLTYEDAEGRRRSVQEMIATTYTDAFLVAKHGKLLHEQYFGEMAADSLHLLNSVTKSLTGMLATILLERGVLAIDDLVATHVPELADGAFKHTTVRHLLDMTAAVAYGEDYADEQADFWHETEVVGWRPALRTAHTPSSLQEFAARMHQTEQGDGEKYHYRTVLTNVLGMVLERSAAQPLQLLLEQELWIKLAPEQDLAIVVDAIGFPYVGAGGNACARDLLRFGQLLADGGKLNGEQIIPPGWLADTRNGTDEARRLMATSDYAEMLPGGHYRNKMWVSNPARGVMMAIGIHGQTIHLNQSTGVVIVKLSSHPESADMSLFADTFAAMDMLSESL